MDLHVDSRQPQNDPMPCLGIIYANSSQPAEGREIEKVADREIIEIAQAIQASLLSQGYLAEMVDLKNIALDELLRFSWIFNLSETISDFDLSDYQVAAELERRNLRFTGSGSAALKACRDKAFTKNELSHAGMLTPAYEVYPPLSPVRTRLLFPLIVKPLYEDGSIGITKKSVVYHTKELVEMVECIHELYRQPALVEEYIDGNDISVSVLGNGEDAIVLPISEIAYSNRVGPNIQTFETKWIPESSEYKSAYYCCPTELDPALASVIGEFALRACRIMDCRDYTLVDFRLKGNTPYVLEVNPNPCINPHESGFVRAGNMGGYSFNDLIKSILMHSIKRNGGHIAHASIGVNDANEPSSSAA